MNSIGPQCRLQIRPNNVRPSLPSVPKTPISWTDMSISLHIKHLPTKLDDGSQNQAHIITFKFRI